jgi:DNA-binding CsgD family transcriptional regulator
VNTSLGGGAGGRNVVGTRDWSWTQDHNPSNPDRWLRRMVDRGHGPFPVGEGKLRDSPAQSGTQRQLDVLAAYVAAGESVRHAAAQLGISPSTATGHVADLRARPGLTKDALSFHGGACNPESRSSIRAHAKASNSTNSTRQYSGASSAAGLRRTATVPVPPHRWISPSRAS